MAKPPETYPFTKGELKAMNSWQVFRGFTIFIMAAVAGYCFGAVAFSWWTSRPDWKRFPNAETTRSSDYFWAKEGLIDSRYGVVEDANGSRIVGYCAAIIPDIKAALKDGKLTNLEVHNLRTKAVELNDLHDFQADKNDALAKIGRTQEPAVECPNGRGLWPSAF